MRFFCRLTKRRDLPIGLNCVARVRLEYPPPTNDPFFVTGQIRDILIYGNTYHGTCEQKYLGNLGKFYLSDPVVYVLCFGFVFRESHVIMYL